MNTESQKAEEHYQAGLEANDREDRRIAEVEFRRAVEYNPEHLLALSELGKLIYAFHESKLEARQIFEKILAKDGSNYDAEMWLAMALDRLGDWASAERHFMKGITVAKVSTDPIDLSIILGTYADCLARREHVDEAEAAFSEALSVNPQNALAMRNYARMLGSVGRLDEAEEFFRKAISIDSGQSSNYRFGQFLAALERDEEAEMYLRRAVKLNPKLTGAQRELRELINRKPNQDR